MIFKLQRPLVGPDDAPILAYAEHHRHERMLAPTEDLLRWFGRQHKVYVEADVPNTTTLTIHRHVQAQPW